jgi:outer membrane protein insertion porin family
VCRRVEWRRRPGLSAPAMFALLTVVFALLGADARSAAGQLRALEVESVRFEGNETFPDDSLTRVIVTQKTECRSFVLKFPIPFCGLGMEFSLRRAQLSDRELPRDQARLIIWYQRRGFREVQIDTPTVVRGPAKAAVVFRIVEGRPVIADSISFIGAEQFEDAELLAKLPLRQGDRLSTLALDATSDTIARRLKNQGYAYAAVFRRALRPAGDPYNAQVTFEIVPGPPTTYGAINVSGLKNLSFGTVRRTLRFSTGDTYGRDEIDEATARLYGLEIVRSATVTPDIAATPDSVVDVDVVVQEGDAYRVRAGGGWSTAECLNVEARWTSRNFLGGGRRLQIRGRTGNLLAPEFGDVLCSQSGKGKFAELTWLAEVDLLQPWIFSTRNSLTASVFLERQSLPGIFIRRAVGFQFALARTIGPQTVLTGFYRPDLSELDADDVLFCKGFLVCAPEDIGALEGANWLSPIGFNLTRDRSDDLLNPRSGYRLFLDVEHAAPWTASDFRYDRVVVEGTLYSSLGGAAVFASRLRGGWVGSGGFEDLAANSEGIAIIHPQKRFYTGGANSVRGFAQNRLGPRVLITTPERLLSTGEAGAGCVPSELVDLSCDAGAMPDDQFKPQPTGGTRVLEANAEVRFPLGSRLEGVAFTDVGQAWGNDQVIRLRDLEFAPGVGVRFPSPVGPIRVDLAYRFRGGEDLSVVTPQIRAFVAAIDEEEDRIFVNGERIPWVLTGELARLPRVLFGEREGRLQLHVSIGQAF